MRKASIVSVSENESTAKDLSGDGKADSPGHSAKYGSYTVIDISCNKAMDIKCLWILIATTFFTIHCCQVCFHLGLR